MTKETTKGGGGFAFATTAWTQAATHRDYIEHHRI